MTREPEIPDTNTPDLQSLLAPSMIAQVTTPSLIKEEPVDAPEVYRFHCKNDDCHFRGLVVTKPLQEPNRCPCSWKTFQFDSDDVDVVINCFKTIEPTCENVLMQQELMNTLNRRENPQNVPFLENQINKTSCYSHEPQIRISSRDLSDEGKADEG